MWNITKGKAYVLLAISIFLEIIGSSCLEACKQFTVLKYTIALIICYTVAFFLFSKILNVINLAVGYATWTAVGTVATTVIGLIILRQHLSLIGWIAVFGIAVSVVCLNIFG